MGSLTRAKSQAPVPSSANARPKDGGRRGHDGRKAEDPVALTNVARPAVKPAEID